MGEKEQNERRPCTRSRSVKDNSVNGFRKEEVEEELYSYGFIRSTTMKIGKKKRGRRES